MPSAPPPYSESQNAQNYMSGTQPSYPPYTPPMGSLQPTQVIVVQAPARKYPIIFCYFVDMFNYFLGTISILMYIFDSWNTRYWL